MATSKSVWITDYATYEIPDDIMEQARELTPLQSTWKDRRTFAYKFLSAWAEAQDKKLLEGAG